MKLTWVIVVVAIGIILVVIYQVRKKQVVVIGNNFAKAAAAEQERKRKNDSGKSPMSAMTYDFWRGEQSLVNPIKNSLDSELSGLAHRFAKSSAQVRADMRTSISMDEFYTLLSFSRRSAVFAINEQNVNWVTSGLTAIAMIEEERTDFRDILRALSLLYHSAKRIGADADQLFRDTAKLSEPEVASLLTGFIGRPAKDKDLRSSWGYDEVETKYGVGFIGWGFKDYHPTYDLKSVIIDIADTIAKDKYQPSSVEVAAQLPPVWLESKENRSVHSTLKKVRGGASVSADLRPNEHPTYRSQVLMVFLVEMGDESAAQELLAMAGTKKPTDYSMIGIVDGKLFCLLVGRSFEQGVKSFETSESLTRFANPITEILRKYSKKT